MLFAKDITYSYNRKEMLYIINYGIVDEGEIIAYVSASGARLEGGTNPLRRNCPEYQEQCHQSVSEMRS